jgi:adenylosuccinate synthase
MPRNRVVLGLQWGDEGKGKVIDLLAAEADLVVRCQGGANAGHTVVVGGKKTVLHLLPSGVLNENARCVIGHGVVLDPIALCHELDDLLSGGSDVAKRLVVSDRAHLVLPSHPHLDRAQELAKGANKVGTTLRGIGPCYTDKAARIGVRAGELKDIVACERKVREHLAKANVIARALGGDNLDIDAAIAAWLPSAKRIAPLVSDSIRILHEAMAADRSFLFEGAQGAQLDLDVGTYPFVTSSNTGIGGILTGSGLSHKQLGEVIGVVKAYTTRVGAGPFTAELNDARGEALRQRGREFGATTGRPRRCGWLDLVIVGYACRLNGVDGIALTKLDILDGEPELPVCVGYRLDGQVLDGPPALIEDLARVEPVYEVLPGWKTPSTGARTFADLPPEAQSYIRFIERRLGVPVRWIGTGAGRDEIVIR